MFIKIIIKKLFRLQDSFNVNVFKKFSNKYITNETLVEEIILKNKFKNEWRKNIQSLISNECYKVQYISISTENNYAKCYVKVKHSFCTQNTVNIHISEEYCHYIIIMTKKDNKWRIEDIINREYQPSMYRSAAENNTFNSNNNSKIRIQSYKQKLSKIEYMKNEYKSICKLYKSNYLERTYPKKYNYLNAIDYARKYALEPNTSYVNYDNRGGDCTNFISQCLHAGNIPYSSNWKPYTNSWIRVNELYYYLLRRGYGMDDTNSNIFDIGSVIQFFSNKKNYFSHFGIITASLPNGDYLYCCHSYNKKDFPLSEVFPLYFDKIRVVKILY